MNGHTMGHTLKGRMLLAGKPSSRLDPPYIHSSSHQHNALYIA